MGGLWATLEYETAHQEYKIYSKFQTKARIYYVQKAPAKTKTTAAASTTTATARPIEYFKKFS